MSAVGLIGLGLVGSALAERFLKHGYRVHGYDLDPAKCGELATLGGHPEPSTAAVASATSTLLLSLPTSDDVEAMLCGLDLAAGTLLLDTTTGDPDRVAQIGIGLADRGVFYYDATIAGSSALVRDGSAVVMLGGPPERVEAAAALLRCFARQWFHLGPCGSGARMKLVVNLVLGLNRAALAEGLLFAERCGIAPAEALAVLQAGPAASAVMAAKGAKMIARDFAPQARLSQHLKDVRLILAQAEKVGAKTPLSALHRQLLEAVVAAGGGDLDNAAILRAFE